MNEDEKAIKEDTSKEVESKGDEIVEILGVRITEKHFWIFLAIGAFFIIGYNFNFLGIKVIIDNFANNFGQTTIGYILFKTNTIRGIIEVALGILSFSAYTRSRSGIIRIITLGLGIMLALLGFYDLSALFNLISGGKP